MATGRSRTRGNRIYWQIRFPDRSGSDYVLQSQLEEISDGDEDSLDLLRQGKFGRARDLRGNLTYIRLNGRLADVFYSMEATNTDFYAYQFKPVVNFLMSAGQGILIADEVGLGKTIEAGLIWTELRARDDARRLLVLCPAMLREKWQTELSRRFGIVGEIGSAQDVHRRLAETGEVRRQPLALIASMQGVRPPHGWDGDDKMSDPRSRLARFLREREGEPPLIDLLIVDEAHYMRNASTMTAALGRLLRDVSSHVVLLSATPVHLGGRDLYELLNLVDQDTFNQPTVFDYILQANEPLIMARDAVLRGGMTPEQLALSLKKARRHPLLRPNRQLAAILHTPPTGQQLSDRRFRSELANKLERVNLLGRVVTRTRKRDVKEWVVLREAIPEEVVLSDVERRCYDEVSRIVRELAAEHEAHEGFLLVMPQRQMASSPAAAFRAWRNRETDVQSSHEDLGLEEIASDAEPGPIITELTRRIPDVADYDELKVCDSKYVRLRAMLRRHLAEFPREKIVLFAYFRPTLSYLHERLTEDGLTSVTLTGGTSDKHAIIARFAQPNGPNVLLASEVASEGVDLQFARVLINYDLPWNPMKVEQRIGRIDRLGQESPKVTIWNLFYAQTIDARIYKRLYERIGVFERTLGGLEPILGDEIRKLTLELLRGDLSPDQEEERIEQAAAAASNYRLEEERLEAEASSLIAHGDYVLNEIRASRELSRWITAEDLFVHIRGFFSRKYEGSSFRQIEADGLLFDVKLSTDARVALDQYLRGERLVGQTSLAHPTVRPVRCSFGNREQPSNRSTEHITQFHPLTRFVNSELRHSNVYYYPTTSVQLVDTTARYAKGVYVFAVHKWSVGGIREIEQLSYVAKPMHGDHGFLHDEMAESVITTAARRGRDWLGPSERVDFDRAACIAEECVWEAEDRYERFVQDVELENSDRVDMQKAGVERHRQRAVATQMDVLAQHRKQGRKQLIPPTQGRIDRLNEAMEQRLRELESKRTITHRAEEVCLGIILVE